MKGNEETRYIPRVRMIDNKTLIPVGVLAALVVGVLAIALPWLCSTVVAHETAIRVQESQMDTIEKHMGRTEIELRRLNDLLEAHLREKR